MIYEQEKWKYFRHSFYEVSNYGRVRRAVKGPHTHVGKILKPFYDSGGYAYIRTYIKAKSKGYSIQQLVARKFIGPRPTGTEIKHKDNNKLHNFYGNLWYAPLSEHKKKYD